MAAASRSKLLAYCRSLPHVTEDVKWGNDLVFSIGAKMFACFAKQGKDATFGCKVPEEDFATLTSIDGIAPAAYAARYHWISVQDPKVLPEREALELIRGSYDLVKSKLPLKTQRAIDAATPAKPRKRG
jgi:predicted DNA-binding protein (MmcQ/YjbR family)